MSSSSRSESPIFSYSSLDSSSRPQSRLSRNSSILEAPSALISQRLVTIEHYMSKPIPDLDPVYSSYRRSIVKRVPVLRLFGPTAGAQRTCLNLHGVFPYIYLPFNNHSANKFSQQESTSSQDDNYVFKLINSLDKAINMSLGLSVDSTQHVFKAQIVSGTPYYGYHPNQHIFIKVFFYNPNILKRGVELLRNGAVMDTIFEPHEAHLSYTQQFMIDYNLQGMNWVHFAKIKVRQNPSNTSYVAQRLLKNEKDLLDISPNKRIFNPDELTMDLLLMPPPANDGEFGSIEKTSRCELEGDVVASDLISGSTSNPGIKFMWNDERERRRQKGILEDLEAPPSPPRGEAQTRMTESEEFWMVKFKSMIKAAKEMQSESSLSRDGHDFSQNSSFNNHSTSILDKTTQKEIIYPSEINDDARDGILQSNYTEVHVPSLTQSNSSKLDSSQQQQGSQDNDSTDLNNETVVDEEVVQWSQSQSQSIILDEDDLELIDLLDNLQTNNDHDGSRSKDKSDQQKELKAEESMKKVHELSSSDDDDDEEKQSLEMSQINWDLDPFSQSTNDDEPKPGPSNKVHESDSDEDLWKDDDLNDSFFQNIDETN